MDIEFELREIMRAKSGNNEIALFCYEAGGWDLMIGNPCHAVRLGEAEGELFFNGSSIADVIRQAKEALGI